MTSTYSTRFRLNFQAPGDNLNTWGVTLNTGVFQLLEDAVAKRVNFALSGSKTLTTALGASDEARSAFLDVTSGTGGTITIPSVEKWYLVRNGASGDVVVTTGAGTTATFKAGEVGFCVCDAANVYRSLLTDLGGAKLTNVGAAVSSGDAVNYGQMSAAISAAAFSVSAFGVPITAGDSGKLLTNNGATPNWTTLAAAGGALSSTTLTAAGLVTGGGDLSAGRTFTVTAATASDVRGGSDTSKALTAGALMASSAFQTLTDAATISWNVASGYNARVTLTASGHTIGAPTGLYDGLNVSLDLVQDATGSRTVSWNSIWDFGAAGLPGLQTTAGKRDRVFGQYNADTGKIECSFRKGA